jgi:hypothetical protein
MVLPLRRVHVSLGVILLLWRCVFHGLLLFPSNWVLFAVRGVYAARKGGRFMALAAVPRLGTGVVPAGADRTAPLVADRSALSDYKVSIQDAGGQLPKASKRL